MTESLLTTAEKARNAHTRVLQAMQSPGKGGAVAAALGVSDSTVSRTKTDHLQPVLDLLYTLGFKIVQQDSRCIDAATYDFLTAKHAHVMRVAPHLIWAADE
jgi:hypothetical protein